MIKTRELKGIIPVVVTPLNEDGTIDVQGHQNLVDFLTEQKVGGLWVLGTNSEDMNLTFEKRLKAAETICQRNSGNLPIILGAGFYCLEDTYAFIDATKHLEFDAYHVMPYHTLLSQDRLEWYYNSIADYADRPLWMYTSVNWSPSLSPALIERLSEHPNIAGMKYSNRTTTDLLKVSGLARDGFQVITAIAKQLCISFSMGIKASTSSLGSCLPESMQNIYNLHQQEKYAEAISAQHKLNAYLDDLPKTVHADNFLPAAEEKYILWKRGICKPHVSSYYRELTSGEEMQVDEALSKHNMLGQRG